MSHLFSLLFIHAFLPCHSLVLVNVRPRDLHSALFSLIFPSHYLHITMLVCFYVTNISWLEFCVLYKCI